MNSLELVGFPAFLIGILLPLAPVEFTSYLLLGLAAVSTSLVLLIYLRLPIEKKGLLSPLIFGFINISLFLAI